MRTDRVRLGLKVGDGSDRRAPCGSDAGARGRPVSGCGEGEARGRGLLGHAGAWAEAEKKGGGGRRATGEERKNWPSPRLGGRKGNSFPFSKFILCSNLLKRIFKTILN